MRKIKKVNLRKGKGTAIFIQNIRTIYDFRQNVLLCLKRMNIDKVTIAQYGTIVTETYKILLLSFKYNQNGNKKTLNTIYQKLKTENKDERKILKFILKTHKP